MNKEDQQSALLSAMQNVIIPHVPTEGTDNNLVMKTFSPETGMFIDEQPKAEIKAESNNKEVIDVEFNKSVSETVDVATEPVDTRTPAEQYRDAVYAQRRETAKLIPGISKFGTEYFVKNGVLPKIEIASELLRKMFKRAELLLD